MSCDRKVGQRVTLLDGGMGHELKLRGISHDTFVAGLLANEHPHQASTVESVHYDYLDAGCDVITTNSFVGVPRRMLACGLASDKLSSNHRAAQLIRAACNRAKAAIDKFEQVHEVDNGTGGEKKLIAGCVPPLTECYFADKVPASVDDMVDEYELILSTLFDCKVDILLCETLSTTREAIAILQALSKIEQSRTPALWISFTINDDEPTKLRSDDLLNNACKQIIKLSETLNLPLEAIGINCSSPSAITQALPIISQAVEGTNIRICAYGNCFQTTTSQWMKSLKENTRKDTKDISCIGEEEYDDEGYLLPCAYARHTKQWIMLGAHIIGGCCGSRPKHMKEVAKMLNTK